VKRQGVRARIEEIGIIPEDRRTAVPREAVEQRQEDRTLELARRFSVRSVSQSSRRDRRARVRRGSTHAHSRLLASICLVAATLLLLSGPAKAGRSQTAETLPQVKRVYVGSLGDKQGATELHDKLIGRLRKARGIAVVASPAEADAIITGSGEIWLTGYVSISPKPSPYGRQAVYNGYLSVELRGKNNATLWSYFVTPGKFQWNSVTQDLVNRLVKKLLAVLNHNGSLKH
jgi:hypothetical protein